MARPCASLPAHLLLAAFACAAPQQDPGETVRLRGQVVTWEGLPIDGAAVALADPQAMATAELLQHAATRTDAEGRFELTAAAVTGENEPLLQLLIAARGHASIARSVPWKYLERKLPDAPAVRAPETDLGQLVLPDGTRLLGRVRDPHGTPLVGVRVAARDLLESSRVLQGTRLGCFCLAISDERGVFQLPTALPQGVVLDVRLDGYYRRAIEPVAVSTPLEIELVPSGRILGRVLDPNGSGLAGAAIAAVYERRGPVERTRTEADGSFALPLEYDARYRLQASFTAPAESGQKVRRTLQGRSAVLQGARANLEVMLKGPEGTPGDASSERMKVRAIDAQSGAPIDAFRVGAVFEDYANQNANYLEYRMQWMLKEPETAIDGVLEIPGPGQHNSRTGIVRVVAKGHAPATVRDVEWKDVEEGKERETLTVPLQPESSITGRVVDETTGEGVEGVMVWALPQQDPAQGSYGDRYGGKAPPDAVATGKDGSFAIDMLGEGAWHLRSFHSQRPTMPPESIELKVAERRTDVVLKLPAGAEVRGRITGMAIPQGTKVFLHELQRVTFGSSGMYTSYRSGQQIPGNAIELGSDGAFAFSGIKLENFLLVLVLPSRPRCGEPLCIPLEPFRVRRDGIVRDFSAAEDRPGTIAGRVSFPAASVPWDRLAVVAQQVSEDPNMQFHQQQQLNGPRSFVGPDAGFAIAVAPGSYQLRLVDFATGLLLATPVTTIKVLPNQDIQHDLEAPLTEVIVRLEAEPAAQPPALVDRLEVRFQPKGGNPRGFGNDNYDSGTGLPLEPGQREVRLRLPPGSATLLLRNNVAQVRVDDNRWNTPPLGRQEFEVTGAEQVPVECTVKIGPPAEIPDPDDKPANPANKADGS